MNFISLFFFFQHYECVVSKTCRYIHNGWYIHGFNRNEALCQNNYEKCCYTIRLTQRTILSPT